jgi:hypothetical protein
MGPIGNALPGFGFLHPSKGGILDLLDTKKAKAVVEKFLSKIRSFRYLRDGRAAMNFAFRFLCLSVFAALLAAAAASGNVPGSTAPPSCSGLPFAIADFDGDSRLDLARVESGPSDLSNTEYWIQLRLTSASWESIRLVAPVGGLQLSARDVNGDASLDLVVSTAWSNRPVAIYLNDGHGVFTHAEPAAFPRAFSNVATIWTCGASLETEIVVVTSPQETVICPEERELTYERCSTGLIALPGVVYRLGPTMFLHAGRAPPSQVFHS